MARRKSQTRGPQPASLRKAEFIQYWGSIPDCQELDPAPVPYKHEGSTYAQDSIRITGTREYIDSVLSHLKPLLEFEGDMTRLQVVYKQTVNRETGLPIDAWNCYIQVHERGGEAKMINAYMSAMRGRRKSV
jgi:hypothetical protein